MCVAVRCAETKLKMDILLSIMLNYRWPYGVAVHGAETNSVLDVAVRGAETQLTVRGAETQLTEDVFFSIHGAETLFTVWCCCPWCWNTAHHGSLPSVVLKHNLPPAATHNVCYKYTK